MNDSKEKQLILKGEPWKVMVKLSLPAIIAMILYGLNVVFDAIFVGRYVGATALAGVSIVYPLTGIPLGLGSMIGTGAGAYLSILLGSQDTEKQKRIVGVSNFLILIISALLMIVGFLTMRPLLEVLGAEGETLEYALSYLRIVLVGTIVWVGGISYNMLVRAEGKMMTAGIMMGVGLLINIFFNYIFMGVFNLGVAGAAWGTNIGMAVYIILFFIYGSRGKASFETNHWHIYTDSDIRKETISLGFPSFIMSIMTVIQGMAIMRSLTSYGTTADVAFYGIVFRVFNFFLTPIFGIMRALQPATGINYGARNYNRVVKMMKVFSLGGLLFVLPLWIIALAFPGQILHLMLPTQTFSIQEFNYFRIFMSTLPILPFVLTAMMFYPSIKKPKPSGMIAIARQVILYIPAMIFLPRFFGVGSIYLAAFCIDITLGILVLFLVRSEFKKLRLLPNCMD